MKCRRIDPISLTLCLMLRELSLAIFLLAVDLWEDCQVAKEEVR